jgi:hypothetical protein
VAKKARRFGPSPALKKARAQLTSTRRSLSSARKGATKGGKIERTVGAAVGGGVSGVIKVQYPLVGEFDTRIPVAAAAWAASMWGVKGKPGTYLACVADGLLACIVSDLTETAMA